ncbi:unnamed protein product [Kuraishia capsulata CBS 1993]|uniref:Phosphoribulokinase/uridine kinase domain-containing protein n=1 Tax=Kuraishia capsulata CBS 1993 TaxID=1382522 RepID=W6MLW8_9ASCO|nr:uncharacterized protein KUCA_T00003140001 [Kuraishia capsulata CBS 1993]CDK27163.1 unnamed protein product [Kuraishia capsulata CBS 1993]
MSTIEIARKFLQPLIQKQSLTNELIVIGVSGPQGSGKTYLSSHLRERLQQLFPQLHCVDISIDDFYLSFEDQLKLAIENPTNWLVSGRGPPGTHDIELMNDTMSKLRKKLPNISIPRYNKSAHEGRGDRAPISEWVHIGAKPVDVVILEGWFTGYTAIETSEDLANMWSNIKSEKSPKFDKIRLQDIEFINSKLKEYQETWKLFDAFVYITTDSIDNVYHWRQQQEHALIQSKGTGMTDEEVQLFVDRYMPSYYLYYDKLAEKGCGSTKHNCRIKIDLARQVISFRGLNQGALL